MSEPKTFEEAKKAAIKARHKALVAAWCVYEESVNAARLAFEAAIAASRKRSEEAAHE